MGTLLETVTAKTSIQDVISAEIATAKTAAETKVTRLNSINEVVRAGTAKEIETLDR